MPIPLLRFPTVILAEIFQIMDLEEKLLNHPSYLIVQQKTGRQAIIYWHRFITLTMDFEL
ncbi:hypothetical protein L3Y34_016410 [Caenorhabditis briggsae]|uniref:Uncharacterized protein n=1 Tax=Caenorhabditis briggsae TaxID=6238 RepID=A0AAE9J0N1_CAEBR|nr:hypothetical protein L3Y34_016410 [Caenorhabditis briggsae]